MKVLTPTDCTHPRQNHKPCFNTSEAYIGAKQFFSLKIVLNRNSPAYIADKMRSAWSRFVDGRWRRTHTFSLT